MLKDVRHVDLFLKMGDVHVVFGILILCFVQHPSYILQCTPPFSTFTKSLISFDFSFLQMFGCLLDPRSFDSPKEPLAHKQTSLPITFITIKLILTSNIAPTTYLKNWALVVLVITIRFMVDQRPFFLEALARINNNSFPF